MNEIKKTIIYSGAAILIALLAFITTPRPATPDAFLDKGDEFFPEFTDPNTAASLEVIDFDSETGEAVPFKVMFQGGKWSIPSHHEYPADGADRLAKTAAGIIGTQKDEFRSDNPNDHISLGVIDPLDETATSLEGRGQRITIRGQNDQILADLIISKEEIEGRQKFRYVRVPDKNRVYATRMDIDISTKFSDWIEADLLLVDKDKIDEVTLKDYSINERTGSLQSRDNIFLTKDGDKWKAKKMSSKQEIVDSKIKELMSGIDELSIVGVRTKPAGLSQSLTKMNSEGLAMNTEAVMSLQSRGFYFTRDGSLVSNEGEVEVSTSEGVSYTLRFGEVVFGSGLAVTAGTEDATKEGSGENRYLFITTSFDGSLFAEPAKPRNTEFIAKADSLWSDADKANKNLHDTHNKWLAKIQKGKKTSDDLNARFAKWYYVISSSNFDKLHLKRSDLVQEKKKDS